MNKFRLSIQSIFLALTVLSGVQLFSYFRFLENPNLAPILRPSSVEGFLPISATLAFRQLITTGVFDHIHPAGLVLLILICGSALIFKRAFCSWICPVGTVSEYFGELGLKLQLKMWTSWFFNFLKYLLLFFFFYISWFALSTEESIAFLASPYNRMADLKMLLFFIEPGAATLVILALLIGAGFLVRNFWCRMLCPYGAWLGLIGLLAPLRVRRDSQKCTNCRACDKACANGLKPSGIAAMTSPSCTLCTSCTKACPSNAIGIGLKSSRWQVSGFRASLVIGIAISLIFVGGILTAKITGHWGSSMSTEDLRSLLPQLRDLQHH